MFFSTTKEIDHEFKGELSNDLEIFDFGTAVVQYPGAGNKQALFGGTPDSASENIFVVSTFNFPTLQPASSYLKIRVKYILIMIILCM